MEELARDKAKSLQTKRDQPQPVIAFIQFQSMNGVDKFQNAMNISKAKRCCLICICRKHQIRHKYLNGDIWPKLHAAPEPSLIMWKNLGIGKMNRFLRKEIINLFSVVIMLLGFLAISYGKMYAESKKLSEKSKN